MYSRGIQQNTANLLADHYTGLTENWDKSLIYCSPVTARLLNHLVGVKREFIHPLAMHDVHHIQGYSNTCCCANTLCT